MEFPIRPLLIPIDTFDDFALDNYLKEKDFLYFKKEEDGFFNYMIFNESGLEEELEDLLVDLVNKDRIMIMEYFLPMELKEHVKEIMGKYFNVDNSNNFSTPCDDKIEIYDLGKQFHIKFEVPYSKSLNLESELKSILRPFRECDEELVSLITSNKEELISGYKNK